MPGRFFFPFAIGTAVITAVATAVLVAAPAQASSVRDRDARHDVVSGAFAGGLPKRPEPAQRNGDIVTTRVALGNDLVVTTAFRELAARGYQKFAYRLRVSGGRHPGTWTVARLTTPGDRSGHLDVIDPSGRDPGCVRVDLDRRRALVTMTVPAACLGDPDSVRVGNGITIDTNRHYADDARLDGAVQHTWRLGAPVTP